MQKYRILIKKIFLGLAVFIFILLIIWPHFKSYKESSTHFTKPILENAVKMMKGVKFHGVTDKGEPYTIHSDKIIQKTAQNFILNQASITLQNTKDENIQIIAQEGDINMLSKGVNLSKGIKMRLQDGSVLQTRSAFLNLDNGTAVGQESIQAVGPLGTLNAGGFEIENKGKVIRLIKKVTICFSKSAFEK